MPRKPNLLLLMADQLNPRALRPYGNPIAHTPHIDALAAGGVVFDAAYCASPLCAPSRYSFMAGQLPSAIGAYDNAAEFAADVPTFAHYLRRAGYHTVLSGKMHFCGPDALHGFEERLTPDIYPADFGWTPDWTRFEHRPSWYHSLDSVLKAGPCVRSNQLDYDEEVVFTSRRKLYDVARAAEPRPFCMVVSLTHPHDPYNITRPYWDLYANVDIPPPRVGAELAPPDPHSRRLRHVCGLDLDQPTPEQVYNARRAYYGAVSFVDAQIGALLATLEETRLADDTIVLLLGDHGEMLGERGLWYKMSFFEDASRIPLIVHAPRRFAPRRVAAAVSLVDILPTLLDLAGEPPAQAAPLAGASLLPHLTGDGGHDRVDGEYLAEGAIAPMFMIREGRYKFVHCPADPDQLYDLLADPEELRNLATAPEHAARCAEYRRQIEARVSIPTLHAQVLASQRRRHFVYESLRQGRRTAWDYTPPRDGAEEYIRNHLDLEVMEAMARFPRG